tara:strand:- start:128 stop:397 length:270 start_codon:yes stop_codon:yes gene_type:complete
MGSVVVKPGNWESPVMKSEGAVDIIKQLEDYFGRPMIGHISMGGIDIEYAEPEFVKQLMIKVLEQKKQIAGEENRVKDLYKTLSGHSYD